MCKQKLTFWHQYKLFQLLCDHFWNISLMDLWENWFWKLLLQNHGQNLHLIHNAEFFAPSKLSKLAQLIARRTSNPEARVQVPLTTTFFFLHHLYFEIVRAPIVKNGCNSRFENVQNGVYHSKSQKFYSKHLTLLEKIWNFSKVHR